MKSFAKEFSFKKIPAGTTTLLMGVIAGIWLAIAGEWDLISYGAIALLVAPLVIGVLMIPGLIFTTPASSLLEKGHRFGSYFFGFFSSLYTNSIFMIWCLSVLIFCTEQAGYNATAPALIWSFCIATGPIAWLASKFLPTTDDKGHDVTFFVQVAYILTVAGVALLGMSLADTFVIFTSVMTMGIFYSFYRGLPYRETTGILLMLNNTLSRAI
ncbi:MAG: hypothetical protein AseanaTS_15860 [Candidatus Pelagadaptatus aseana]|uniref:hypothetical protein n=1 Tax=Candidatus Pelagadaptatus aseana TaxID=3120508 RepID=UPI0039B18F1A